MVKKATGFCVQVVKPRKKLWTQYDYVKGGMTKEQALKMAVLMVTSSNPIEISKEYDIIDRSGDIIDNDMTPYGIVKKVKRKDGYAYTIQLFDKDGWETYKYDLHPNGRMTNRR